MMIKCTGKVKREKFDGTISSQTKSYSGAFLEMVPWVWNCTTKVTVVQYVERSLSYASFYILSLIASFPGPWLGLFLTSPRISP